MRILFIDIDTLRPDHLGCYGYPRNTTPNIDHISKEGITFEKYYCSDAPCLPSRASLISGIFGIRNGAVGHGGTAADKRLEGESRGFRESTDIDSYHNIFRKAGYYTASISTYAERHSAWWFNAGLNECINVGDGGLESGQKVLDKASEWIGRKGADDNWYLHVHFWDPHTPYRVPEYFGDPFKDVPMNTWITDKILEEHLKHVGPHSIRDLNMFDDKENPDYPRQPGKAYNMEELKRLIDGYDTGILYADHLVGQIVNQLKLLGVYNDTMIIVSSDHGENMGELGIYAEHATADNGTCRIPMIIKGPGLLNGHRDRELHYSLDLLPTMADLLDVKHANKWDGCSYIKTIREGKPQGRKELVISQMAHVCQRSARFDDWLYIRTYHDGFHLFKAEMLFDLKNDPHEQSDVSKDHNDLCALGAKIILDWHDEQMKKSESTIDPLWTVMKEGGPFHTRDQLEHYLERLKATDRSDGAEELKRKYL